MMKKYKNFIFSLICISIILFCALLFFIKYKMNLSESEPLVESDSVPQITLEDDEPYYLEDDDNEPHISNYISNTRRISYQTDFELPINFFQTLPGEIDNYLQSLGYYDQPLYVYESSDGFYRMGTCIYMNMQIGDTGDILSGIYHIYEPEYEFFIIKGE